MLRSKMAVPAASLCANLSAAFAARQLLPSRAATEQEHQGDTVL
jgi:hypothetical protein